MTDFEKYASLDRGISSMTLNSYGQFVDSYINPDVANIIQAQLLYLASVDDKAEISLYINTPGGAVSAGLGIYDTMQLVRPDIATICTGMAASMGQFSFVPALKVLPSPFENTHASTAWGSTRTSCRYGS